MNPHLKQRLTGKPGCLFALGIGLTTVVAVNGADSLLTGTYLNLSQEWSTYVFQTLLVAAPFGLLAIAGVSTKASWITCGILTAMFWPYLINAFSEDPIGRGLLMLISPLVITVAAFSAHAVTRRGG